MPAVSFSHKGKAQLVETGQAVQTIRPPRKRPWKARTEKTKGDTIYLYWHQRQKDCRLLGVGEVISVVRKQFQFITKQEFLNDGFDSVEQAWHWFMNTYRQRIHKFFKAHKHLPFPNGLRAMTVLGEMEFDIIRWRLTRRQAMLGEQM